MKLPKWRQKVGEQNDTYILLNKSLYKYLNIVLEIHLKHTMNFCSDPILIKIMFLISMMQIPLRKFKPLTSRKKHVNIS